MNTVENIVLKKKRQILCNRNHTDEVRNVLKTRSRYYRKDLLILNIVYRKDCDLKTCLLGMENKQQIRKLYNSLNCCND